MLLSGSDLAGYIKNRHAQRVQAMRGRKIFPRMAVVQANDDPVIDTFVRIKQRYGDDIGVQVDHHKVKQEETKDLIRSLNADGSVHGIIVQLPLAEPEETDEITSTLAPAKDIDGLSATSAFDPVTPTAIMWLLSGYGVELTGKEIVVVGHGRLVGDPLIRLLEASGHPPAVVDEHTKNLGDSIKNAEVIITATGEPGLITEKMVQSGAVVVDAGTADVDGQLAGDVTPAIYERSDIQVTPTPGGVGPMTVAVLFENLLVAADSE